MPHESYPMRIDGRIQIGGSTLNFPHCKILEKIGSGANGIVFKTFNTSLNRVEALKVWLKTNQKNRDSRDKKKQGYLEANAMAKARHANVPVIYSAGVSSGHFYCFMEFFEATTLQKLIDERTLTLKQRIDFAEDYLFLVETFGSAPLVHGDPHLNNVLISGRSLVLTDFGTSYFSKQNPNSEDSRVRHWRLVRDAFAQIIYPFNLDELLKTDTFIRMPLDSFDVYDSVCRDIPNWLRHIGLPAAACGPRSTLFDDYRITSDPGLAEILDRYRIEHPELRDVAFLGGRWFP